MLVKDKSIADRLEHKDHEDASVFLVQRLAAGPIESESDRQSDGPQPWKWNRSPACAEAGDPWFRKLSHNTRFTTTLRC